MSLLNCIYLYTRVHVYTYSAFCGLFHHKLVKPFVMIFRCSLHVCLECACYTPMFVGWYSRWCPPSYKLVISQLTIDISPINHSYWSYLHQLNAILGAPPCSLTNRTVPAIVLVGDAPFLWRNSSVKLHGIGFIFPALGWTAQAMLVKALPEMRCFDVNW